MKRLICIAITALAPAAWAAPEDSYAGQQHREIKSLSVEERADLLAGRGMGLAKAGELNGYPGPRHVLDLAAQLSLSTNQRTATEAVFSKMQTRAKELGAEIIAAEQALDRAFAAGDITAERLDTMLGHIGTLNARLRGVHLAAHLEQTKLLSKEQIATYKELRGYTNGADSQHGNHAPHEH